jgi:hypothetical protein
MKTDKSKINKLEFLKITSITGVSSFLLGANYIYGAFPHQLPPIRMITKGPTTA